MIKKRFLSVILLFLPAAFLQIGCSGGLSSQASYYAQFLSEIAVCNQETIYDNAVILAGTAKFQKRGTQLISQVVSSQLKLTDMVLGDPLPEALPIQNAEIAVYDSKGSLVQCGQTDSSGNFKNINATSDLYIPNSAQTFTIRILARSNIFYTGPTDFLSVSVKKDSYRNDIHFVEQKVYSDGVSGAAIDLVALARQVPENLDVTGGAFNILNNIQQSYTYIKNLTTPGTTNCLSTKLNVYWKAGFNPVQYLQSEADPSTLNNTSYYLQDTNELFISGGQVGDVSLANTDHFDDFATIHELGHFIEKNCGQFTSPGGSHALIVRIDPRLAWSEGWANYFATQVLNVQMPSIDPTMATKLTLANENYGWTHFFNSAGFSDSVQNIGNGLGFFIDFKRNGTNPGDYASGTYTGMAFDKVNPTLYPGEGHTREGAISRGIYKLANDCGPYCITTSEKIPFSDIWKSFDQTTGIANTVEVTPYLSSYHFISKLKTIYPSWIASHDSTIASEALHVSAISDFTSGGRLLWPGYGKKLTTGACSLTIQPRTDDPALTGSNSDQRYANHNFSIQTSQLPIGTTGISVQFTKTAGTDTDHDLLLFQPYFKFNDDYTCTAYNSSGGCSGSWVSQRTITDDVVKSDRRTSSNLSGTYTKTLTGFSDLNSTEKYLLNIRSYTANKSIGSSTAYDYVITTIPGGTTLCPEP